MSYTNNPNAVVIGPDVGTNNGDMAQATVVSIPTAAAGLVELSYQCVWTGAPVGTWSVEVCNYKGSDRAADATASGTWTALTFPTLTALAPAGSASDCLIDLQFLPRVKWVRLKYTKVSGTGNLVVTVQGGGA